MEVSCIAHALTTRLPSTITVKKRMRQMDFWPTSMQAHMFSIHSPQRIDHTEGLSTDMKIGLSDYILRKKIH